MLYRYRPRFLLGVATPDASRGQYVRGRDSQHATARRGRLFAIVKRPSKSALYQWPKRQAWALFNRLRREALITMRKLEQSLLEYVYIAFDAIRCPAATTEPSDSYRRLCPEMISPKGRRRSANASRLLPSTRGWRSTSCKQRCGPRERPSCTPTVSARRSVHRATRCG